MPALLFSIAVLLATAASDPPLLEVPGLTDAVAPEVGAEHDPPALSERWWSRSVDGRYERVAEVRFTRPVAPAAWLALWRRRHGCVARVIRGIEPIHGLHAAQLTFGGTCEGGDSYVIHLVQIKTAIVELHVDTRGPAAARRELAQAMRQLLARVRPRSR